MAKSLSNNHNAMQRKPTFRPLTIAQENAIDLLITGAIALAQDFCTIVRERQADRFDHWLARRRERRGAPTAFCHRVARG